MFSAAFSDPILKQTLLNWNFLIFRSKLGERFRKNVCLLISLTFATALNREKGWKREVKVCFLHYSADLFVDNTAERRIWWKNIELLIWGCTVERQGHRCTFLFLYFENNLPIFQCYLFLKNSYRSFQVIYGNLFLSNFFGQSSISLKVVLTVLLKCLLLI